MALRKRAGKDVLCKHQPQESWGDLVTVGRIMALHRHLPPNPLNLLKNERSIHKTQLYLYAVNE